MLIVSDWRYTLFWPPCISLPLPLSLSSTVNDLGFSMYYDGIIQGVFPINADIQAGMCGLQFNTATQAWGERGLN